MPTILSSKPGGSGGGGPPSGSAGGDLSGSYPNPDIAPGAVEESMLDSGAASSGDVLTADGAGGAAYVAPAGGGLFSAYALLRDEKASTTNGGTFTQGAYRTRELTVESFDTGGFVTLAANQFTLLAGTYFIYARCPANYVNQHKAKLRNVTDAADTILGASMDARGATTSSNDAIVQGRFTIAASKAFEIQHICATTVATEGFGVAAGQGTEVYTEVQIWREA